MFVKAVIVFLLLLSISSFAQEDPPQPENRAPTPIVAVFYPTRSSCLRVCESHNCPAIQLENCYARNRFNYIIYPHLTDRQCKDQCPHYGYCKDSIWYYCAR